MSYSPLNRFASALVVLLVVASMVGGSAVNHWRNSLLVEPSERIATELNAGSQTRISEASTTVRSDESIVTESAPTISVSLSIAPPDRQLIDKQRACCWSRDHRLKIRLHDRILLLI